MMAQKANLVKGSRLCNNTLMAKICFYDVSADEEHAFSNLPGEHDVQIVNEQLNDDNVAEDAEVISVFVTSTVNEKILKKMPKLKLIACRSTGFNNIDLAVAKELDIAVTNVPTYGEHTVAEYTFGLLLSLTRKINMSESQMFIGQVDASQLHGIDLKNKTLGIIGSGRIGKNVARIAEAFGMKVLIYDPYYKPDANLQAKQVTLAELAETSDVISLHAPLTDSNRHIINASLFNKMKDGVYIINTARGELVDGSALISAIKSGKVAGAGIDVLEDERLLDIDEEELLLKRGKKTKVALEHVVANTLLMRMPNVILTSHNAYNTKEAIERINQTTIENIKHYLAGALQNEVLA